MSSLFTSRIFFAVNGTLAMSVAGPSRPLWLVAVAVALRVVADIGGSAQIRRE